MSDAGSADRGFVETREYRRFVEFCEACLDYRYVGLCYGAPGVGKTLSGRRYADWDRWSASDVRRLPDGAFESGWPADTAFYTAPVVNAPRGVQIEIEKLRRRLHEIALEPLRRAYRDELDGLMETYEVARADYFDGNWFFPDRPDPPKKGYADASTRLAEKEKAIADPTRLIVIDEADRLKISSLEAVRDLFDQSDIGLILIGMPGIEKRMARYPQLYSRIGFVHEFRPLGAKDIRLLLDTGWRPPGIATLPIDDDALSSIIRITGGNFRLLQRMLTQTERVADINGIAAIDQPVVDAARESLVIGRL
ncbi:MAG: AAA family ATPase [Pseudomonadota bacterium]